MKYKMTLLTVFTSVGSYGISFSDGLLKLKTHDSVEALVGQSKALSEDAESRGSWGDPTFKIAAMNYPADNLVNDQSAMTGVEFGLSQKISLTTKYGHLKDSLKSLSKAYSYEAHDKQQSLTKAFWEVIIIKKKNNDELEILKENLRWITKILSVSKKLYGNGRVSQQAILDIEIRKSEIESDISNKEYEISQIKDELTYFIGTGEIEDHSIPWEVLKIKSLHIIDNRSLGFKEKLRAKQFSQKATKLNYIPDVTVSLAVTKRSNLDGHGDFVGASLSFPLPFSDDKYSQHAKAVHETYMAVKSFEEYKKRKKRDMIILEKELRKLTAELKILKDKTIKFARNSRSITSKSYALGNSSYIEVLQSELKLQQMLMRKVVLYAKRDIKRVALKYITGEPLYE